MSTGARAPRRPSAVENDTGINQDYMRTVPPTSSIRHSVSGAPSPSTSTSLPAEEIRTGAAMVGSASNSENNLEPLEELITTLRRPTSVLAPGGQLRPNNTTSPSLVTDVELHSQHAQSHSSTPTSNPVVQALGDVFRVPISGYSAPASIGDSTWRTLGFDGTTTGGGEGGTSSNAGFGFGTRGQRGIRLGSTAPPSAPTSPSQDDEVWTGDWAQSLAAGDHDRSSVYLDGHQHDHERHENADYGEGDDEAGGILVIPSLGDRAVENDVHALLEVHGITSRLSNESESSGDSGVERTARQRSRPRRMRIPSYRFLEEEEEDRSTENTRDVDLDADGEVDAEVDDMNTGSSHGDYEYYSGGSSSSHRTRRLRARIRQESGYEHDFGGVEEVEEQGMDDRMDVDVDMDIGGGVEEDCESEESDDEEDRNSTRTRVIRQSPFAGYTHSPPSSRRHGTSSSSNAGASTSAGSTGTPSSIPFPKSNTNGQNPAHNYGYGSRYGYYDDLDLAGICFDPSGERMYVAGNGFGTPGGGNGGVDSDVVGAGAVVEWSVRGAEKRWWVEEAGWK